MSCRERGDGGKRWEEGKVSKGTSAALLSYHYIFFIITTHSINFKAHYQESTHFLSFPSAILPHLLLRYFSSISSFPFGPIP